MTDTTKALAIIPRTLDESRTLATLLAKSSLVPADFRGKEADVFVQVLAGLELGLPPMAAIRSVHLIKGKPVRSADGMVGLVLGSGIADYFSCIEENDDAVTYETRRKGSPHAQRATWTLEDAKRAGLLSNDNWRKYPRAMLKARCKAVLARDVYPDVLAGCYDTDEAREFSGPAPTAPMPRKSNGNGNGEIIDAELVESPADDAEISAVSTIEQTGTVAELQALAPQLKKLAGPARDRVRNVYGTRLEALRATEGGAA